MPHAPASSRAHLAPGHAVGVDEDMIRALVHAFYADIRRDPALGPIFNRAIHDWDAHLVKLCDFWSSVTLMTGRFKGRPMQAHADLPDARPTHFARWLHLWRQAAERTCPPPAAALFVAKAEAIAQSLQIGIAASRGEPAPAATQAPASPTLPDDVRAYAKTAVFTEETVPPGLLREHTTKAGSWGLIHVLEGRLAYRITDPRRPRAERLLTPQRPPGVVEPTVLHDVQPLGPVRFYVEFLRRDSAAADPA